ncbi:MAG: DUF4836 family protein [Flavobacteriaceae bacterium]
MTTKQFKAFILITSLLIVFTSCKKSTNTTNAIPKDTNFVMAIDMYSLIKKGQLNELSKFDFFNTVKKEIRSEDKKTARFLNDILDNPTKTGVNYKKEIFVYTIDKSKNEKFMSVLFSLTSDSKFTEFVSELSEKTNIDKDIVKNENYNFIQIERNIAIGWKNKKAILLTATNFKSKKHLEFEIETLLNQKADKSIKGNSDFNKFTSNQKDVNFWLNTSMVKGMREFISISKNLNYDLSDNFIALHLNFNKDNVHLKTNLTPNSDLKNLLKENKYFDKSFNSSLLNYIPKEQLGVFSMVLNPKAYLNTMKKSDGYESVEYQFRKEMNMSIDNLITAIGGSAIFSFFDVKNQMKTFKKYDYYSGEFKETEEESLTPIISLAFDIKDKAIIQKIIAKFPEDEFKIKNDYYTFKLDDQYPAYFAFNDKLGLITNDEVSIKSFKNKGLKNNLNSSSQKSSVKNNFTYGHLKLNLNEYPIALRNELNNKAGRQGMQSLKLWNDFAKSIEFNQKSATSFEVTYKLNDSKNNSLYTILNTVDKNYKSLLGM